MQSTRFKLSTLSAVLLSLFALTVQVQTSTSEPDQKTLPVVQVRASADTSSEGLQPAYAGG